MPRHLEAIVDNSRQSLVARTGNHGSVNRKRRPRLFVAPLQKKNLHSRRKLYSSRKLQGASTAGALCRSAALCPGDQLLEFSVAAST